MTNDITIDCSTATLNFRPQYYYYLSELKILILTDVIMLY